MSAVGEGPARPGRATLGSALGAAVGSALAAPFVPELALLTFTVVVYRDGLWSVPRWDHLIYLYEASRFATSWDLLAHAPAWNRAVSVGDHIEFRPLFHIMLGVEQVLFGRVYAAWQAVGIALHGLVAVLLFRLGRRAFRGILAPLLLAALFASALLVAETVVWFHANAYVLCAALLVASLDRLLAFLETGRPRAAWLCVILAFLAAFTYEVGPVYCAVAGTLLVVSGLGPGLSARSPRSTDVSERRARLAIGGAHLAVTAIYVAASAADLLIRFHGIAGSDVRAPRLGDLGPGVEFALRQIGFWLGGLAFPTLYDIAPGSRAAFLGLVAPSGPSGVIGVLAAMLSLAGGAGVVRGRLPGSAPGLVAGTVFLGVYSLVVAVGRSVPRGLAYTINQNLQHAYPALLAAIVTIALAAWSWRRSSARHGSPLASRPWLTVLALGAAGLIWANATSTTALLAEFRHSYDAPKLELIHHVERWHVQPGRAGYFRVAEDCPGHDALPWFKLYLRHDTPVAYFVDIIFPATSLNLQRARLAPETRVDEIACAGGDIAPGAVAGRWWEGRRSVEIHLGASGGLEAISPNGLGSPLILQGRTVLAPSWRARGVVSHDARYIFWRGAIPWHR